MLNKKLNEVLEWLDYGKSELYSGTENLPDYRANESSRDSLSQAESYLVDVEDMLKKIIKELGSETNESPTFGGDTGVDADFERWLFKK